MALEVAVALPDDMPRIMDVQFSAFGDKDPYHRALYPGGDSASLRASAAKRTLEEAANDPTLHIVKCSDRATGTICGFATWHVYDRERPVSEWQKRPTVDWCEGREKEVAEAFLGATADMRAKTWNGRPHVCQFPSCYYYPNFGLFLLRPEWDVLSRIVDDLTDLTDYVNTVCALLCVHEDFQRRGAGTLLVRWGLERAAALGVPAYLEATPAGYPLYLTLGFSEIDVMVVKAGMWDGDRDLHFVAMLKDVGDASSLRVKGEMK